LTAAMAFGTERVSSSDASADSASTETTDGPFVCREHATASIIHVGNALIVPSATSQNR
jgi:hypothetical protein